jgi:hypothetical protein
MIGNYEAARVQKEKNLNRTTLWDKTRHAGNQGLYQNSETLAALGQPCSMGLTIALGIRYKIES